MGASPFLALAAGLVAAGLGGDIFVRGLLRLARWTRVPGSIVGATVAAFATSSAELSVSLSSAFAGRPEIGMGDALGSNVVNIGLIMGLALLANPVRTNQAGLHIALITALLAPLLTILLLFDSVLGPLDGLLLLLLFAAWLALTVVEARRARSAATNDQPVGPEASAIGQSVAGLALLFVAGRLIVSGGLSIADAFGVAPFLLGSIIVSIGTSIPELATTAVAILRKRADVAFGTVLGSSIFNGLFIVGAASLVHPIRPDLRSAVMTLAFGVAVTAAAISWRGQALPRWRGALLLALYVIYLLLITASSAIHPAPA